MNAPSPPQIDALLFDLGNVVIEIDFQRVLARWARDAGCAPDRLKRDLVIDEPYKRYERGLSDLSDYFAHLRVALDVTLTDEQFLEGWNAIFVGEMAGIGKLLEAAKQHVPLYVFSNTNRAHEIFWAKQYADVLTHFRKLFVSSTIGLRKPDREAFDYVAGEMGVAPSRILFFDDLAENVMGAKAAGFHAVQTRTTADIVAALARYLPHIKI